MPQPGSPQAFNRYSYVYNNPVAFTDPSGNFPWLAAIGAVIGAAAGGISAHKSGQPVWQGILFGGLQGFGSGLALGSSFHSIAQNGHFWGLTQAAGGLSLAGQVAGAAGNAQLQRNLNYGALGLGALYLGRNVLQGVKDWAHENRFGFFNLGGQKILPQSGDRIHINGISTTFDEALSEARFDFNAEVLAYNPSSGPVADLTEAFLGKATFTSSISRQIGNQLSGLSNITLTGFSQGGIIASNAVLNLGLRGQNNVVNQLRVASTQVSQVRVYISGAIGGLNRNTIAYGVGSPFDFSNFLGPNMNPVNFAGGAVGMAVLPLGIGNHYAP